MNPFRFFAKSIDLNGSEDLTREDLLNEIFNNSKMVSVSPEGFIVFITDKWVVHTKAAKFRRKDIVKFDFVSRMSEPKRYVFRENATSVEVLDDLLKNLTKLDYTKIIDLP